MQIIKLEYQPMMCQKFNRYPIWEPIADKNKGLVKKYKRKTLLLC